MGPLAALERRFVDRDQTIREKRIVVGREFVRIPLAQVTEDPEPKLAGVLADEVDPDRGVVIGRVGELNGIAEAWLQIDRGIEAQPKRDGSGPFGRRVSRISRGAIEDSVDVLSGELKRIAETTRTGRDRNVRIADARSRPIELIVRRRRVEDVVTASKVRVWTASCAKTRPS